MLQNCRYSVIDLKIIFHNFGYIPIVNLNIYYIEYDIRTINKTLYKHFQFVQLLHLVSTIITRYFTQITYQIIYTLINLLLIL